DVMAVQMRIKRTTEMHGGCCTKGVCPARLRRCRGGAELLGVGWGSSAVDGAVVARLAARGSLRVVRARGGRADGSVGVLRCLPAGRSWAGGGRSGDDGPVVGVRGGEG